MGDFPKFSHILCVLFVLKGLVRCIPKTSFRSLSIKDSRNQITSYDCKILRLFLVEGMHCTSAMLSGKFFKA